MKLLYYDEIYKQVLKTKHIKNIFFYKKKNTKVSILLQNIYKLNVINVILTT